jgi:hypothetical protein
LGKRNHYVYLTCDSTDGRLYWGVRSCKCQPEDDPYFGSHCDDTYNPDLKWVWNTFPTREEAENAEQLLLKLFNSVDSPTFANLSSAQWKQWTWVGSHHTPQTRDLLSKQKTGKGNPQYGKPQTQKQKDAVRRASTGRRDSPTTTKKKQLAQKENARLNKRGTSVYHNPETNQHKYFLPLNVPEGWVKGFSPEQKRLHTERQRTRRRRDS